MGRGVDGKQRGVCEKEIKSMFRTIFRCHNEFLIPLSQVMQKIYLHHVAEYMYTWEYIPVHGNIEKVCHAHSMKSNIT